MFGFIAIFICNLPFGWAHRPEVSLSEIHKWGFRAQPLSFRSHNVNLSSEPIPYLPNSLSLPLLPLFPDPIGGIMHQLQDYTKPDYFHAGIDLRALVYQEIQSPVAGQIEAGYYAYSDNPDGSTQKYILSYADSLSGKGTPPWGDLYFEIAIVDKNGFRFEFHHIDPDLLSKQIIRKILNKQPVKTGESLGKTARWPGKRNGLPYHHVHYNIISPNGIYVNPLYLSTPIQDSIPPNIHFVYSVKNKTCEDGLWTLDKIGSETSNFIVVESNDYIQGKYFATPPTHLRAVFGDDVWEWNYAKTLSDSQGFLPDIRDLYVQDYCDLKGRVQRGTKSERFFIKIPVPDQYNGPVLIEAFDFAGNKTTRQIMLSTPSI